MNHHRFSVNSYAKSSLKSIAIQLSFTKTSFIGTWILPMILLTVFTSCSKNGSDNNNNNINTDPLIDIVSPLTGPKNTAVMIKGAHFGNDVSKTKVYINGVAATVSSVNDATIWCKVPVKAGSGIVKVVTANGKTVNGPSFTYKYTATITTLAGGTNGYADGTGTAAQFGQSNGLCNDSAGNVYMVDYFNSKVRMVTPAGVVTTIAGGAFGYADGIDTSALFSGPLGICYAGNGNFYIADTYNYLIRKMTSAGVVTTVAGTPNVIGYQDGNDTVAKFNNPAAICIDASGNLYVADAMNNKIRKIDTNGNVTTLAGSSEGYADGPGLSAKFSQPSGICVDPQGNVYVAEFINDKIRKISPAGVVSTLAGSTAGSSDGVGTAAQFTGPAGLCIDKDGNIFVAEAGISRIRMVTPSGVVTTIAGDTSPEFFYPSGVSIDSQGILYVMDTYNYRIRKIILD